VGLKLNGTHHLHIYAGDINIVMNMTIARQQFGKHRLKAGIAMKRSGNPFARQRFRKHIFEVT
jgi:hypothetical protein